MREDKSMIRVGNTLIDSDKINYISASDSFLNIDVDGKMLQVDLQTKANAEYAVSALCDYIYDVPVSINIDHDAKETPIVDDLENFFQGYHDEGGYLTDAVFVSKLAKATYDFMKRKKIL